MYLMLVHDFITSCISHWHQKNLLYQYWSHRKCIKILSNMWWRYKFLVFTGKLQFYHWPQYCYLFALKWQAHFTWKSYSSLNYQRLSACLLTYKWYLMKAAASSACNQIITRVPSSRQPSNFSMQQESFLYTSHFIP